MSKFHKIKVAIICHFIIVYQLLNFSTSRSDLHFEVKMWFIVYNSLFNSLYILVFINSMKEEVITKGNRLSPPKKTKTLQKKNGNI